MDPLRSYIRLVLESSPSKKHLRLTILDADSTGGTSHLNATWSPHEEQEMPMAQHLAWSEELEDIDPEEDERGPVPPQPERVHIYPDIHTRGQYDNVTWQR